MLDSRPRGRGFEPHWRHCGVTGIIPFSDCGEFAASLVSGVVSLMVEGRVGSVKGFKKYILLSISNSNLFN